MGNRAGFEGGGGSVEGDDGAVGAARAFAEGGGVRWEFLGKQVRHMGRERGEGCLQAEDTRMRMWERRKRIW